MVEQTSHPYENLEISEVTLEGCKAGAKLRYNDIIPLGNVDPLTSRIVQGRLCRSLAVGISR